MLHDLLPTNANLPQSITPYFPGGCCINPPCPFIIPIYKALFPGGGGIGGDTLRWRWLILQPSTCLDTMIAGSPPKMNGWNWEPKMI